MTKEQTPWSDELVEALKWYQKGIMFHPYTCGHCRDTLGTRFLKQPDGSLIPEPFDYPSHEGDNWKNVVILDRELVPTKEGFVCPTCGYKQTSIMEGTIDMVKKIMKIAETHEFYTQKDNP